MYIEELKKQCAELFEKRKQADALKAELSTLNKEVERLKSVIADSLETMELPNFDTGFGKVSVMHKTNTKISNKEEFFTYLKSEGIFEDLASVNYQTLNAFYREKLQESIDNQDTEFSVPGVETSIYTTLQMRGIKS